MEDNRETRNIGEEKSNSLDMRQKRWWAGSGWKVIVGVAVGVVVLIIIYGTGQRLQAPISRPQKAGGEGEATLEVRTCTDGKVYHDLNEALKNKNTACYLDLSNQSLSKVKPQIGNLRNLRSLDLSNNKLTKIPSQISYMRPLETMDLSGNELTGIPAQVGYLKRLKRVDWSENQLTSIPVQISYFRNIEEFDLSDNQLAEIPEHVGYFRNLRIFDLRNNQLTRLPERIDNLHRLKRLELGGNPLPPYEVEKVKKELPRVEVNFVAGEQKSEELK